MRREHEGPVGSPERDAVLDAFFDACAVGMCMLDRDLRYLRLNAPLAEMIGLPVAAVTGRTIEDTTPDLHDTLRRQMLSVFRDGRTIRGFLLSGETPAAPGDLRHWSADYFPVRDAAGTVIAVGAIVVEITEKERLRRLTSEQAQALFEREARLTRLIEGLPIQVGLLEGEGMHLTTANDALWAFLRRPHEEFHPHPLTALLETPQHPSLRSRLEALARDGGSWLEAEFPLVVIGPDGTAPAPPVLVDILVKPLSAAGRREYLLAFQDVTQRVASRRDLHLHARRHETIVDNIAAYVGLTTADGTLLEVNRRALEDTGLRMEDVLDRPFWDCPFWADEVAASAVRDAMERARTGETVHMDVATRTPNGGLRQVDFRVAPVVDDDGRVVELVPSGLDMQPRIDAEKEKDLLLAELEHRVKNTIATVQSIVFFTADKAEDPQDIPALLDARLAAMARSHERVTASRWSRQVLERIVALELRAARVAERARLALDPVQLSPDQAIFLGLAMHELIENALVHGALSTDAGRLEIRALGDEGRLRSLHWQEHGGPPVTTPRREGFGLFLLTELLSPVMNAAVALYFDRSGFRLELTTEPDEP